MPDWLRITAVPQETFTPADHCSSPQHLSMLPQNPAVSASIRLEGICNQSTIKAVVYPHRHSPHPTPPKKETPKT